MKSIFASLFLILPSLSNACPNLAGNYPVCKSNTMATPLQKSNVSIQQKTNSRSTTYQISMQAFEGADTTKLVTDGKVRVQTEADPELGTVRYEYKAYCQGKKLVVDTKMFSDDIPEGMEETTTFEKVNGQLIMSSYFFGDFALQYRCK